MARQLRSPSAARGISHDYRALSVALVLVLSVACGDDGATPENQTPSLTLSPAEPQALVPGASIALSAEVSDPEGDELAVSWTVESTTVAGLDCSSELGVASSGLQQTLTIPLRYADVRCADELLVRATVSDGELTAEREVAVSVAAPAGLGEVWQELDSPGNPLFPLRDCPQFDCLSHSDPSLARGSDGTLLLWFSAGGDLGEFPVVGRARQETSGAFALDPATGPVLQPVTGGGVPWDDKRETVSVSYEPASDRWDMTYLGYATDYFTDPAIGLMRSSDVDGKVWERPAQPIYTPSRPDGWDAAFLTSPTRMLGSDGVWRLYFAGASFTVAGGRIGVLTSSDGITWTPAANNPIFDNRKGSWDESVIDCFVSFVGGRYLMWYSAFIGELAADTAIGIGLATSEDGYSWQRVGDGPVIAKGATGTWNDLRVLDGEVILEADGSLLMAGYGTSTIAPNPSFPDFKPERLGLWRSVVTP